MSEPRVPANSSLASAGNLAGTDSGSLTWIKVRPPNLKHDKQGRSNDHEIEIGRKDRPTLKVPMVGRDRGRAGLAAGQHGSSSSFRLDLVCQRQPDQRAGCHFEPISALLFAGGLCRSFLFHAFITGTRKVIEAFIQVSSDVVDVGLFPALAGVALPVSYFLDQRSPGSRLAPVAPMNVL